jgi:hypothetical protein
MFEITIKTITTEEKKIALTRENAEIIANTTYMCDDVYAVEIVNGDTGELVYYKAKG